VSLGFSEGPLFQVVVGSLRGGLSGTCSGAWRGIGSFQIWGLRKLGGIRPNDAALDGPARLKS